MMKQMKEGLGISLISLIVTIIVLLILAGVTLATLTSKNGILNKAETASFSNEVAIYKEELNLTIHSEEIDKLGERNEKINVEDANEIKSKYIPSFNKEKYSEKLVIKNDKLVYIGKNNEEEYRRAKENDLLPDDELIDDEILEEYQPFITEWTVGDKDTIVLPLSTYGHNIYNFQVDYGDGTVVKVKSATDENATHVYEIAGTYTVTIKGQCPGFKFSGYNKEESNKKITKIIQWGNVLKNEGKPNNGIGIDFKNCINLKGPLPEPTKNSLSKCKNVSFENCKSLDGNIPNNLFQNCVDTNFSNTFNGCISLTGEIPGELFSDCIDAGSFDGCFANCTWITSIPEDLFKNCTNATTFKDCFRGCTSITKLPDNLFKNCTNVNSFMNCFYGCTSITKIPNNLFENCTKVNNFRGTFGNIQNLESIGNNIFKSEQTVDFYQIFEGCYNLKNIPEDLFKNCPNTRSFNCAFNRCTSLTEIPEGLFDNCKNVEDFYHTFQGCANITGNAPNLWERTNVKNSAGCFRGCNKLSNYNEIPTTWGGGKV